MTNNSWKKKARRQQIANGVSYTRARREVDREYDAQSRVNADTLLSALGIENPDSLDVEALWEPRRRPAGATGQMLLRTPVGLTPEGNPIWLDLKDAPLGGHGPHGVMIGMTGSGKSTALQTMVLGLCALHSPEVLQVIPVSGYKESALDAFANYPHVTIQPEREAGNEPEAGDIAQTLDRLIEQRSQALTDAGIELTGRTFRDVHAYHKARDARRRAAADALYGDHGRRATPGRANGHGRVPRATPRTRAGRARLGLRAGSPAGQHVANSRKLHLQNRLQNDHKPGFAVPPWCRRSILLDRSGPRVPRYLFQQ